ncbi:MAG TPA: acyltransferase [Microvirga sp.]
MSKLVLIQALRGLAALAIALLHARHEAGLLAGGPAPASVVPWAAGVDVFFVISGFIMVHASGRLFEAPGARPVFLARRVARIVPLYWAVTSLYLLIALAAPALLNSEWLKPWPVLASFLFIPFARPDGLVQPLYSLGWTLNYEMAFYVLFALVLPWARRSAVLVLIGLLVALAILGRAASLPQPLAFWTSPIILEFAFGLAIGLLRAEGVVLGGPARAGLALAALAGFALAPVGTDAMRALVWGGPAALLVAAAALGPDRALPRNAATRLAIAIGDASYALYLVHPFVIRGLREATGRLGIEGGGAAFILVALLAAILAALAVHRLFERPATEALRRWLEPDGRLSPAPRA